MNAGAGAAPRLRRAYFECRWGQLHLHNAIPAGGGFDELTPLLCIHDSGGTGRHFADLLPELGRDRSVYAPDMPGTGQSDAPPTGEPVVAAAAAALADFLDTMRLRQVDVVAEGAQGIAVAAVLATQRARSLRRIVLQGSAPWPPGLPTVQRLPEAGTLARVTALRASLG